MAVLRLLLRRLITINVEAHRIGLVGETDNLIREYLLFRGDRVAPGWYRVDSAIPFRFQKADVAVWSSDNSVHWIGEQLALDRELRTANATRIITTIGVLDRAFLAHDPLIKVIMCALAVEVGLSGDSLSGPDSGSTLQIAARAAYLTCPNGCASTRPACPYVVGFAGSKDLLATAERWSDAGVEWRCSPFLDVARPVVLDEAFSRLSLFGARNEAAHEGRTSLSEKERSALLFLADHIVHALLCWTASHNGGGISELDEAVAFGVTNFGVLRPGD